MLEMLDPLAISLTAARRFRNLPVGSARCQRSSCCYRPNWPTGRLQPCMSEGTSSLGGEHSPKLGAGFLPQHLEALAQLYLSLSEGGTAPPRLNNWQTSPRYHRSPLLSSSMSITKPGSSTSIPLTTLITRLAERSGLSWAFFVHAGLPLRTLPRAAGCRRFGSEPSFNEAPNRFRAQRLVFLALRPSINSSKQGWCQTHADLRVSSLIRTRPPPSRVGAHSRLSRLYRPTVISPILATVLPLPPH
jgi:hypothetical protein